MKICCVSDMHGFLPAIPECDVLVIAGDVCPVNNRELDNQGSWLNYQFLPWTRTLRIKRIVMVAGNHDFIFDSDTDWSKSLEVDYLRDSEVVIDGVKFYGSPYTPKFGPWAFMLNSHKQLEKKRELIPDDVDVLVTHGPPRGVLDVPAGDTEQVGCWALKSRTEKIKPRLHVFGHIHGSYGKQVTLWDGEIDHASMSVNASHVNESYEPVNDPIVVEI